jgi:hypothetical protein
MSVATDTTKGAQAAPAAPAAANALQQRRPLEIPAPAPPPERVVRDVLAGLADKRKEKLIEAQETIQEFGLTIEVTRLRERLVGMPPTDLRRLLLATAGVPEALFLDAIAEQLEDEQEKDQAVTDASVDDLGKAIQTSFAELSKALTEALKAIADRNGGTGPGYSGDPPVEAAAGRRSSPAGRSAVRREQKASDEGSAP